MSYNIQNNSISNWQENSPIGSQIFQPMPIMPANSSCFVFQYPAPAQSVSSPNSNYAINANQIQYPHEIYSPNNHLPSMAKDFFNKNITTPTRYNQALGRQKRTSNPLKRYKSLDEDQLHSSKELPKKGVKGIPIDAAFYELQRFAYDGCTFAETVAQSYRKRPCFKKIDLLLSRLKNDLNVYHNIQSNVNSQGTAWAIKDFTFAYSRIINAWVILRGYVYDQTEGLDTLRSEFDADYIESFAEWQSATLRMMKSLMRTVENLNISAQYKSGNGDGQRKEPVFKSDKEKTFYSKEFLETFQKTLFTPKCAPNSEEIQIRNHHSRAYFRAGVLKPLMIDNTRFEPEFQSPSPGSTYKSTATPSSSVNDDLFFNWWSPGDVNESPIMKSMGSGYSERLYNRGSKSISLPTTPIEEENIFDFTIGSRVKKTLLEQFNSVQISD